MNFAIPYPAVIQITLLNSKGQLITNLINHYYSAQGSYCVPYNGSKLSAGVYYLKFLSDDGTKVTLPIEKL